MKTPQRIVDAHHHLWDLKACHYPWLMARGVQRFFGDPTPIQTNYLPADFKADFAGLNVEKSVHIQVGVEETDSVKETLWLDEIAKTHGLPNAIVAFCDLTSPCLTDTLAAHGQSVRLRGVRQIVGRSSREDRLTGSARLLESPDFEAGLKTLARHGLSFDLQLVPNQMQRAAALFRRIPELRVALCHCGSLNDRSLQAVLEWEAGLRALSGLENLICKISGFGMYDHTWTAAGIRRFVLTAIDIFTPRRVAFGSNFPVDKLYASYGATMGAYIDITSDFSTSEREAMFAANAEAFYRI
jgi:predicted TIM-barrel fold metal-dependent hydrolase